jgi:hypothetical protein
LAPVRRWRELCVQELSERAGVCGDLETQDLTTMSGATCETATTVIDAPMEGGSMADSLLML